MKLVSPWVEYYRKLEAMFKDDPEITLHYNNIDASVTLFVDNQDKADALTILLPAKVAFGDVELKITIVPSNVNRSSLIDIFRKAFNGNPIVSEIRTVSDPALANDINFIVFENKVVQYFNDDAGDLHGLRSTLYEDLAREIFTDTKGIYFCTESEYCDWI